MGVKKPDRRIANLTSQLHNAEEAWRKARADSNEAHKLLVKTTQKLKEMIDGEKFEWEIQIRRRGADRGVAYVKASSQEEADKLAEDLTECEIEWDCDPDDFTIESVEPSKPGNRG